MVIKDLNDGTYLQEQSARNQVSINASDACQETYSYPNLVQTFSVIAAASVGSVPVTSFPVTSLPGTRLPVTSLPVTPIIDTMYRMPDHVSVSHVYQSHQFPSHNLQNFLRSIEEIWHLCVNQTAALG